MFEKETLKIVIIGHVDHGKSTLIGRLLLETNSLPKEKIAEMKRISRELGKEAEFAYLVDQLKEERERNITIDTTQIFFSTRMRQFVIIDVPGHVEFLRNMITGATQAQAALLLVDANEGMMEQTRRHAFIIHMLGIRNVVVLLNKMDVVGYSQERFEAVKDRLLDFFKSLGLDVTVLIPISAREGINITKRSPQTPWYQGPVLIDVLNRLGLKARYEKRPLRFPIQDVYRINAQALAVGRVTSGVLKKGQRVLVFPQEQEVTIQDVQTFDGHRRAATKDENIGVTFFENSDIKRGDVIVSFQEKPPLRNSFCSRVFWMSPEPLRLNSTMTLRCATQDVKCVAEKIEKRINSSTLEILQDNAGELQINEAAIVTLHSERPIITEAFHFIEELGRFSLEKNNQLQGAGIMTEDSQS